MGLGRYWITIAGLAVLGLAYLFSDAGWDASRAGFQPSTSNMQALGQTVTRKAAGRHSATLIMLHGLGDTGSGWARYHEYIALPHFKIIYPTAPIRAVTSNNGAKMPAWFDVQPGPRDPETLARGRKLDEAGIAESVQIVEDLISAEEANGIPVSRIVIGGFSQGGMIALKVATNRPTRVGGVVALSTFFQVPDDATVTDSVKATPVFVGHGTTDPIIPVQSAQIIEDFLAKLEIKDVNRHYYPGVPHASCVEEFRDFKKFLLDVVPDDA